MAFEASTCAYNTIRRALIPFVLTGGYDMVLLSNGHWVHNMRWNPLAHSKHITAFYSAESHTIVSLSLTTSRRPTRCDWISFTDTPSTHAHAHSVSGDLTLFFEGLRIATDLTLSAETLLLLAYNQTGLFAMGPWTVQTRSGDCETVSFNMKRE